MKRFYLFIFCFFFVISVVGAEPKFNIRYFPNDPTDERDYKDERLQAADIFEDGSFIVGGWYDTYGRKDLGGNEGYAGLLLMYDKNGNELWEINPSPLYDNVIWDLKINSEDDIIAVGFNTIMKVSSSGQVLWYKNLESSDDGDFDFEDVALDDEDNIYTADDIYIYKYNTDGELIKKVSYGKYVEEVIFSTDGNILVAKRDYHNRTNMYATITKYDTDLNVLWEYTFRNDFVEESCRVTSLVEFDGKYYFFGQVSGVDFPNMLASEYELADYFVALNEDGTLHDYFIYSDVSTVHFYNHGVTKEGNILAFGDVRYENGDEALNISTYSLKGELLTSDEYFYVEKIPRLAGYDCACGGIATSRNGYVLTGFTVLDDPINPQLKYENGLLADIFGYMIYDTWPSVYNILSETDGNGRVSVVDSASFGSDVTFEVIPNDGFEIDKVYVTDSNNNLLVFTKNKFTMPSADVIVSVSFKKSIKNPITSDYIIFTVIALVLMLIAVNNMKKNYDMLN